MSPMQSMQFNFTNMAALQPGDSFFIIFPYQVYLSSVNCVTSGNAT